MKLWCDALKDHPELERIAQFGIGSKRRNQPTVVHEWLYDIANKKFENTCAYWTIAVLRTFGLLYDDKDEKGKATLGLFTARAQEMRDISRLKQGDSMLMRKLFEIVIHFLEQKSLLDGGGFPAADQLTSAPTVVASIKDWDSFLG